MSTHHGLTPVNKRFLPDCEILVNICLTILPQDSRDATDQHLGNNGAADTLITVTLQCAKAIKEILDKKFGASWHVVVGEGFGFELSYEVKKLLYMFFAGTLAVCVWKCS